MRLGDLRHRPGSQSHPGESGSVRPSHGRHHAHKAGRQRPRFGCCTFLTLESMATEPWAMTAPTNLPVAAQPPSPKTSAATNALPQRMCLLMLSSDRSQGKCILQPSLAHRTAAGWLTTFKGREAGLVCGVTAGLVCAVKQVRFCSFGQNCCWIRNVCADALWVIILPTSDDKAGVQFFDRPGRREAAGGCYFDSNQSTDQPRFFIVESISSPQM